MYTSTYPDHVGVETIATRGTGEQEFVGTNAQRKLWREEQAHVFLEAGRLLRAD
jgi:hypothetical protein